MPEFLELRRRPKSPDKDPSTLHLKTANESDHPFKRYWRVKISKMADQDGVLDLDLDFLLTGRS